MVTATTPRIAVVTGARRGLGRGVAEELARRGLAVVLTGTDEGALQEAVAAIRAAGGQAEAACLDVNSDDSVNAFFDRHLQTHGTVDVLVNNAGRIFERDATGTLEPTPDVLLAAFSNNALSCYRTARRALPVMNERGYGRIVNVTSGMGSLSGMGPGYPAYRVSKTAQNALTKLLAFEAKGNVKVNGVCPGWVRTDMGGAGADRDLPEGVASIVWAAVLDDDGPTGGLFRDGRPIEW
jgi:NAD(P)-dependent dehydrogenase (short-subunit alcohol dehydrogenase family)